MTIGLENAEQARADVVTHSSGHRTSHLVQMEPTQLESGKLSDFGGDRPNQSVARNTQQLQARERPNPCTESSCQFVAVHLKTGEEKHVEQSFRDAAADLVLADTESIQVGHQSKLAGDGTIQGIPLHPKLSNDTELTKLRRNLSTEGIVTGPEVRKITQPSNLSGEWSVKEVLEHMETLQIGEKAHLGTEGTSQEVITHIEVLQSTLLDTLGVPKLW